MRVGEKNRIGIGDIVAQGLLFEIRTHIDQQLRLPVFDKDRRCGAAVFRVFGVAFAPAAARIRNAIGGAAAQYSDFHVRLPCV